MASRDKKDLHNTLAIAYENAVVEYKRLYPNAPQPFLTCTFRDNDEQNLLFLQKPKVTNAKGGESPHNYFPSLAFDLGFITVAKKLDWAKGNFEKFAAIITQIEPCIEWGGVWVKFVDFPHYQLKNWKIYLKAKI